MDLRDDSAVDRNGMELASRGDRPLEASPIALIRLYHEAGALREAVAAARQSLPDLDGDARVEAQLVLADSLLLLGMPGESKEVRSSIADAANPELQQELDLFDARLMREEGHYTECCARFAESAELGSPSATRIRLTLVVAECHRRLNQVREARRGFERAITLAGQLGWPEGMADGLMSLALLDRMEGYWERGERLLERARSIYRERGCSLKATQAILNIGTQRLWRGRLHLALEALNEAAALSAELGRTQVETTARTARGLCLLRLDRMEEARLELTTALRLARRGGAPRRLALALEFVGELRLRNDQPRQARRALQRALRIARQIAPEGDIVPEVLRRLAEVELVERQVAKARRLAEQACALAGRHGDRYEQATALRVLGMCLRAEADASSHADARRRLRSEAEETLRRALLILTELGEIHERDRVRQLLRWNNPGSAVAAPCASAALPGGGLARSSEVPELQPVWLDQGLVTSDLSLRRILREAELLAASGSNLLILGETGTGKELAARAVHALSGRPGVFLAFNCAALPVGIAESELFGAVRGAYTGADRSRRGLVQDADGGTLFLDEVGDLDPSSQGSLLRFLDDGEVRPLGSTRTVRVRCGIVAATLRPLRDEVEAGRFRGDLYYRLAEGVVELPPLRARLDDLLLLIPLLWRRVAPDRIVPNWLTGPPALAVLREHSWPGNIRELLHFLRRLAAVDGDFAQTPQTLRALLATAPVPPSRPTPERRVPTVRRNGRPSVEQVREALRLAAGSPDRAAERLGVSRSTLYRILRLGEHH